LAIGPASFGYSWRRELVAVEGRCCTSVLDWCGPLPVECRYPADAAGYRRLDV